MDSKINQTRYTQQRFNVKLIGKSYVGKTTFINGVNHPDYNSNYEKTNLQVKFKLNLYHDYKSDIFYFDEEPERNLDTKQYQNLKQVTPKMNNDYIALIFMFDISDKNTFDYLVKIYDQVYYDKFYSSIMKVVICNKVDLDKKLWQVKKEDIDIFVNHINAQYFEISSKDTKQINTTLLSIYEKVKNTVKNNEYKYGDDIDKNKYIDKEKNFPNYYEICIIGDNDSGKECLKNKFLYDIADKTANLYEYIVPRTLTLNGKEIKYNLYVKRPSDVNKNNTEFDPKFYYSILSKLDPCCSCILLTYDITNEESCERLKIMVDNLYDIPKRYQKIIYILGMKCDLLEENQLEEKIKEGRKLASTIKARFYLVSNSTGYNVDIVFNDILLEAYYKYHPNERLPPTVNFKENSKYDGNLFSQIHIRKEKAKMVEKTKRKIERQIEKEELAFKKMKTQKDLAVLTKKKKDNDTYFSSMKELFKNNYSKIFRCTQCFKIPKYEINELENTIHLKCFHKDQIYKQTYRINEFIEMKNKIFDKSLCICKNSNPNSIYLTDYCYNCQKLFCKKCEQNHKNNKECEKADKKNILPFYMIDSFCTVHENRANCYCNDCNMYTCNSCFAQGHDKHNFKFYNLEIVEELINSKKKLIELEKKCYNFIQRCFNDCMLSIKNQFNQLMDIKMKKLTIKENLVRDLELLKTNYNLIESVSNLKFNDVKVLQYNIKETWKTKLNFIFDYMGDPLYIKSTNICIKDNIGRPYNILNEIIKQCKEERSKEQEKNNEKNNENNENISPTNQKEVSSSSPTTQNSTQKDKEEDENILKIDQIMDLDINNPPNEVADNIEGNPDDILITDICPLSSKYFGISSDDGLLKIYNAYNFKKKKALYTVKEFKPNKGVFSLYKPNKGVHLNSNPLYLIGYETIKKLLFNIEYTDYTVNEVYTLNDCYYINIIELQNLEGILISTTKQNILSLKKNDKNELITNDLTYMLDGYNKNKKIISIDEISSNKFNVRLKDEIDLTGIVGEKQANEDEKDQKIEEEKEHEKEKGKEGIIMDNIVKDYNSDEDDIPEVLPRRKDKLRQTIGKILRNTNDEKEEVKMEPTVQKRNIYNIIIELDTDKDSIKLKNVYEFYKNFDILGKINSSQILLVNKNIESKPTLIYLFDINTNEFLKRFYIQQNIPVFYHQLVNWVKNSEKFLLLDDNLNLTQYMYENDEALEITPMFSLDLKEIVTKKNKDDNVILMNVGDKIFLFANNGIIFRINN